MSSLLRATVPALMLTLAQSTGASAQATATPPPGEGRVILDCLGDAEGRLSDCKVALEKPSGGPFGRAALARAEQGLVRAKPVTPGGRVFVPFDFTKAAASDEPGEFRRLAAGAAPTYAATVAVGETIVTIPYTFKRTGVLKTDIVGVGLINRSVQAPAGTVGFHVGDFSLGSRQADPEGAVWCFFPPPRGRVTSLCLFVESKRATVMPMTDPYTIDDGLGILGSPQYVSLPDIEERPVQIPGDLRISYRFAGWKRGYAEVERWTGDRKTFIHRLARDPDGRVHLRTLVGEYQLAPASDDPSRAQVSGPLIIATEAGALAP